MGGVREAVGRRVRNLRLERGLTQEALALSANIDRSLLIDLEKGRRSLLFERLYDLAAALDVPVTEIVQDGPAPPSLNEGEILTRAGCGDGH